MFQHTQNISQKQVILWILAIGFLLLICYFLYDGIFKKPKELNNGIVKIEKTFREHTKELWAVRISPDGRLLASVGIDSAVRIWREDSGQVVQDWNSQMGLQHWTLARMVSTLQPVVMMKSFASGIGQEIGLLVNWEGIKTVAMASNK